MISRLSRVYTTLPPTCEVGYEIGAPLLVGCPVATTSTLAAVIIGDLTTYPTPQLPDQLATI
jgi:hypothetical protein